MIDQPNTTDAPTDLSAWDEAFQRVESYLRALGVESRVQLNAFATEIINAARASAPDRAGVEPVTLAMQQADERIGAWFGGILPTGGARDERFHARGRLALIMADVAGRWPQQFLSVGAPPAALVRAMNETAVQAGPEVRFTNMAAQPLELPPPPTPGGAGRTFGQGPLLRAAAMWVVIIGLLGVTWAASH